MIRPADIAGLEAAYKRTKKDIPVWCAENDVDEDALIHILGTYGACDHPRAVAICAFQLGHDARRLAEPRGEAIETPDGRRYVVQHVVIDATNGTIAAPPTPSAEFANGLAATFNEPLPGRGD